MNKIVVFFIKLVLFIFSYFLYLINLFFIYLKLKNISKFFFIYAAYFCSKSLGVSYKLSKESRLKLYEKGIHIANHDNPLDIFVAQFIFRMPTITTIDQHLKKILPYFELSLKNFGHYSFNHLDFNHRKSAYLFLQNICNQNKSFLIYPSGSIYTKIDKRFSKSVSKLSINNNLKVIAWRFYYKSSSEKSYEYNKNLIMYILKRFLSHKIELYVKKVEIFQPKDFLNEEIYHNKLRSFYKD